MSAGDLAGRKIHFMGVGGIGMSALAELAKARGAIVDGCDREASENTERLRARGIGVRIGHDASHVRGADMLVVTSAVPPDHPERRAAVEAGIEVVRRGTFLARLMKGRRAIGICGTHGKTTTTWMTAHILLQAGLDPTVVLGGTVPEMGGNLHIGRGDIFVAELDESDGSFLEPELSVAVVTNVESDHLHHYGTFEHVREAFARYADGVRKSGLLVWNREDAESRALFGGHAGNTRTFGHADAEVTAPSAGESGALRIGGREAGALRLRLPGNHNVQNALAALAAATSVGVPVETALQALSTCRSVDRRMELLGAIGAMKVYTDYAHHPTEVRSAIRGARSLHPRGLTVVFQPHLFSRTRDYADAFGSALAEADRVLLAPIYPAREAPLPGVCSEMLAECVRRAGGRCDGVLQLDQIGDALQRLSNTDEAAILMGAGDIWKAADAVLERGAGVGA